MMAGVLFNGSRMAPATAPGVLIGHARFRSVLVGQSLVILHNYAHVLRCSNFFNLGSPAVWEDITPVGVGIISGLTIDPDGIGAWLVTGVHDSPTDGVWRATDIRVGDFGVAPVLTQDVAQVMADVARAALGWGPFNGTLESCVSLGNGLVCVTEQVSVNALANPPSTAFISIDGGATWTVSVPSGASLGGVAFDHTFWAQYGVCHVVDWDGVIITIAGRRLAYNPGGPYWAGGVVRSIDYGVNWLNDLGGSVIYYDLMSCNTVGVEVYVVHSSGPIVVAFPSRVISVPPQTDYSQGFRRTQYGGQLVQILYSDVTHLITQLCLGEIMAVQVQSGVGVPLFGAGRVLGVDSSITLAYMPLETVVVLYHLAGVHYDRTGNLLAEIGVPWEGTSVIVGNSMDASGIEVTGGNAGVYFSAVRMTNV